MNNKRKNRPGPSHTRYINDRPQRGRTVSAQGIYNNSYFMHAATSYVGNLVQIQTHSGSIYEGIFRTFSPTFDVALELVQCIKNNQNLNSEDSKSSLPTCMIFQPNHIVSIVAREVDLEYAVGGAFQTDSAISLKCNGSSRSEEKELEPWDPTGSLNGDIDLELDGNANGWDANDMFNKNEKLYGVQSTFDNSLTGYTVQIEKKDTQDYKKAEAEAEKIAHEIENHSMYKERIALENGDEETAFAAVERPNDTNQDANYSNNTNSSNMPKVTISVDKYVPPPKRKNLQTGKLVRNTQTQNNNNNNNNTQHISHNNNKNNNYQSVQMQQQGQQQYMHNQMYQHAHSHQPNSLPMKNNGENGNGNIKSLPQRNLRQYGPQSVQTSYGDNQSTSGGQMQMGKIPVHIPHNHGHSSGQHVTSTIQETQISSSHITGPTHHIVIPTTSPNTGQNQQPPPQPQRQPRPRDEQIQELRKFHQDFNLNSNHPAKASNISPHSHPQPSISPSQQQQQQQQQLSPMPPPHQMVVAQQQQQQFQQQTQLHQQQIQNSQQQQQHHSQISENSSVPKSVVQQQHIQSHVPQEQINYNNQTQNPQTSPNNIIAANGSTSPATTPPQTQQQLQQSNNNNNININTENSSNNEKNIIPPTVVKKTHVLNPAAKPFTPRSPSTPNASRPHTPATPAPSLTPNVYAQSSHVAVAQQPMVTTYVMQPQQASFQTPPHPHAGQQNRLRRGPVSAAQMQVSAAAAAATGQPLLTAAPQFLHYPPAPHPPPFQSQPYQHMVRMFHEPPPQQIQFLAQTPPSTTPSPGQPHQQFHPGPQPSPAGGGPPTFATAGPQAPHFPMMCPVIASHPQLVPNYYQGAAQTSHHAQQFQVIMQQQHPTQ